MDENNKSLSNLKNNEYTLGIDEAGRGPTLGPMVYACALWKNSDDNSINKDFAFDDSKKLTDLTRRNIYYKIKQDDRIKFYIAVNTPQDISAKMLRRPGDIINLNEISYSSAVSLVNFAINDNYNITNIFADAVGPKHTYEKILEEGCIKKNITIRAEEKADSKYKTVSAASIIAKVTRDLIVENWDFKENNNSIKFSQDLGSGYPADPNTKNWLINNFHPLFIYPDVVRFSWKTIKNIIMDKGLTVSFKDYDGGIDNKKTDKFIKSINENKPLNIKKDEFNKSKYNLFFDKKSNKNIIYYCLYKENNLSSLDEDELLFS